MKLNKSVFIILLSLLLLFLLWSYFQPKGILATIKSNLWSVDLLNQVANSSDQVELSLLSSELPHSAVLTASQALRQDQPDRALDLIQPLLNFTDPAVQGTYAEILYAKGDYAKAIDIWESKNETIILERTARVNQEGNPESILLAYQALYRLDPAKYTSSLAVTLKNMDRLVEAAELLENSRKAYPDSDYASDWLRYLADTYSHQQNWQRSEELYLETIKENPTDKQAWRNLGQLYLSQLNSPEKAIKCFQKMVELSPNEAYGYTLLAQAYEKSGNLEQALQTYRRLLLISPENSAALQAIDRLTTPD